MPRTHSSTRSKAVSKSQPSAPLIRPISYRPNVAREAKNSNARWLHASIGLDESRVVENMSANDLIKAAGWQNDKIKVRTRQELLKQRKNENLPHISYDIDGDGCVSDIDQKIARKFDSDRNGILSPAEKKAGVKLLVKSFQEKMKKLRFSSLPPPKTAEEIIAITARFAALDGANSHLVQSCIEQENNNISFNKEGTNCRSKLLENRKSESLNSARENLNKFSVKQRAEDERNEIVEKYFEEFDKDNDKEVINPITSRKEMLEIRKTLTLPNLTYDVDGDGNVSQRDFYLARQIDKNGDGVLTLEEQETAWGQLKHMLQEPDLLFHQNAGERMTQLDAYRLISKYEQEQKVKEKEQVKESNNNDEDNLEDNEMEEEENLIYDNQSNAKHVHFIPTSKAMKTIVLKSEIKNRQTKYKSSIRTKECLNWENNSRIDGEKEVKKTRSAMLIERREYMKKENVSKAKFLPVFPF